MSDTQQSPPPKAGKTKVILALILMAGLVVVGRMWWRSAFFEETDNAYVSSDISAVAPRVDGVVTRVLFEDNQKVHAGDLLLKLDPNDYEVRVAEIRAQVLEVDAALKKLNADVAKAQADRGAIEAASAGLLASLNRYQLDAKRQQALRSQEIKAVTQTDMDEAIARRDNAEADYKAHAQKVQAAVAAVEAVRASGQVLQAKKAVLAEKLKHAELQLSYTQIRAPVDGWVGKRGVEVGDHVMKGQHLVALVHPGVWVTANFKEIQLAELRPGQVVDICLDSFPGTHFNGRIDSFSPATGAKFALLPPENATGNFTKIVQRVPVKITFDKDTPADKLARVVPGMSALVEIDLRQTAPNGGETGTK